MTPNPRVANENDDVLDWLRIMSNDRFRRLPVVDSNGKIKVIFTQGDFVSYTWPDLIYQASQLAKASFMKRVFCKHSFDNDACLWGCLNCSYESYLVINIKNLNYRVSFRLR